MTNPTNSPAESPDSSAILKKLTDILSIGAGFDDPYAYAAIEAAGRRSEAFGELLLRDYPILGYCGCGSPEKTLEMALKALGYCTLTIDTTVEREDFLQENFGVRNVTDDGLLQFLFYSLIAMGLVQHDFSLALSTLTPTGEVFLKLLDEYVASGPH